MGNSTLCYTTGNVSAGYAIKLVTLNKCEIKIYCNSSLPVFTTTLNSGGFLVKEFSNKEFCKIESTSEVLIAQFSLGKYYSSSYDDVFMTLVTYKKQYYNKFKFTIINDNIDEIHYSYEGNNNYGFVNIIVMAQYYQPGKIYILTNGSYTSLDNELWQPIKANNITEAYATQLNITYDTAEVYHINKTALMAVMVYGFSYRGSHGTAISGHVNKGMYVCMYVCM